MASKVALPPVRGAGYEPGINFDWFQSQREVHSIDVVRRNCAIPSSLDYDTTNNRAID
jgi:hypothetical protein